MKLTDLPRALLRRWYLLLVGLAITAGIGFVTLQHNPPTYQAQARVLMLPPAKTPITGSNPFLNLDGLRLPADLVAQYMTGPGGTESFEQDHPTATFTVGLAVTATNGPVLSVVALDRTPAEALSALNSLIAEVPQALAALEKSSNAPTDSSIRTMLLVRDDQAELNSKDSIRALVVAVGAGLLATLFVVFATDGIVLRMRARRRGQDSGAGETNAEKIDTEKIDTGTPVPVTRVTPSHAHRRRRAAESGTVAPAATATDLGAESDPPVESAGSAPAGPGRGLPIAAEDGVRSSDLDAPTTVDAGWAQPSTESQGSRSRTVRLRPASSAERTAAAETEPSPPDRHRVGTGS